MHRRRFLRAASATCLIPALDACARTFHLSHDRMLARSGEPPRSVDPDGTWAHAVSYARWTPSPHNTQPWRLLVTAPTSARVYYDPRRLLPTTDPTGAFTMMGLAMFVEYLRVALRARGFDVRDVISERPLDFFSSQLEEVATLDLVPATSPDEWNPRLILDRQTSRLPYDGTVVGDDAMQALRRIAAAHGTRLDWSYDADLVHWMIDLNRHTLFSDLSDEPTRRELRRWIRTTDLEARENPDGLWSQCMRFPGWLMRNFFDDYEHWGRGWRARRSGDLLVRSMRGTRTVAWWSGPFATPADWIATGRVLSYTWLELTRRGIQIHPFGSVITNTSAHQQLVARVGGEDAGNRLWLLARLGRSATPPRSHRLETARIFVTPEELA